MKIINLLFIALLYSSCATKSPISPWSLVDGQLASGKAGLVVETRLADGGLLKGNKCQLILVDKKTGEKAPLDIRSGERMHFFQAPPGPYRLDRIKCGLFSRFRLHDLPDVILSEGKFSLAGRFEIDINDRNNLEYGFVIPEKEELYSTYLTFPDAVKNDLISAYTAKNLPFQLFKDEIEEPTFKINLEMLAGDLDASFISTCIQAERKRNPLQLGHVKIAGLVKEGTYFKLQVSEKHSYSDSFTGCLVMNLKNLSWKSDAEGKVDLVR